MEIKTTSMVGTEVEGLIIKDTLVQKLLGGMTDWEKARAPGDMLLSYLAIAVSVSDGIPIDQALLYVNNNTERVS